MNPEQTRDLFRALTAGLLAALLAGCGGGGDSSSSVSYVSASSGGTGSFTLAVTDAPVDDALQVVVTFTAVSIKPEDGEAETFVLTTPQSINLLDYTGGDSVILVDDEPLAAGNYEWVRLAIDEDNTYIIDALGGQHELRIPSGAQTGLKLNREFHLPADGILDLTIDFDLRKSVHLTGNGVYMLRPTLRVVAADVAGALTGAVDGTFISALLQTTGRNQCYPAVYVFDAGDPIDDLDGVDDPVATVLLPVNGPYNYAVDPLEAGDYRIAFTCDADIDNPDDGDPATDDDDDANMTFTGETVVSVTADQTTVHDFQ